MNRNIKRSAMPRWWALFAKSVTLLLLFGATVQSSAQFQIVVPYNKIWKFEQSNIDLGTAWKDPGFDDSGPGWGTGQGPLGFNGTTTNEALLDGLTVFTLLNRSTNGVQPRTYYFRTTFEFTNDPTGVSIIVSNLIDDAAVFWLNGVEVGRAGFNLGTVVTFSTPGDRAASDVTSYGYDVFTNINPGLVQGINTYAIEVHQTGNNSSDLALATRVMAVIPTPLNITQQPTNVTSVENRVLNITVGLTGSTPQYQWYRGTNPAVAITDATNATYTIANTTIGDTGDYFVIATNFLNAVTSQVARVTISNDTNGPVLLSVKTDETFQRIILTWDETLSIGPVVELSNYVIQDSSLNVISATSADYQGNVVVLHVPTLAIGANYTIEIDYQSDLVDNPTLPVGSPVFDPNGIVTNFHTWVISPGFTRFQAYLGLPANQNIAQFTAMPIYPNGQSFGFNTNVLYWPQSLPGNGYEQYAMRFSGLFVAPETGLYQFNSDHDDDVRLRFSDSASPSGTITEAAAACCTGLLDGPTMDLNLVAGQSYYYELIVREFGGGDHAGISVITPSGITNSPISQDYLAIAFDPANTANAGFSQQPQNQSISENHAATFSVVVTNAVNGIAYQWQLNSGGGFANITGAISSGYTTPLRSLANNNDQYRVLVYTPGLILTSAVAVLNVGVDTVPPLVLSVRGTRSLSAVRVAFNEAMDSISATTVGNYTLTSNGVPVAINSATLSANLQTVTLQTVPQVAGTVFNLSIQGVKDVAGNTAGATNFNFQTWTYSRGFVLKELYLGLSASTVVISDLRNSPNYPDSPSIVRYGDTSELNTFDEFEGYGARLSGVLIPAATGNHTFYISSDDNGELWLSTNSSPSGISYIAREPVYAGRRVWTGESAGGGRVSTPSPSGGSQANISGPMSLVAGQQYYFEALVKEGGGGDNLAISWQTPGGPVPVNGNLPTGGFVLAALADPVGASVTITQQPLNTNILAGQSATFTVRADGTNISGSAPFAYQWQRFIGGLWQDIAGAVSSSYVTAALSAGDSGSQFRVLVFIPGAQATSAVATVNIVAPAPTLRSSFSGGILTLSWDAPARLQYTLSLNPPIVWVDINTGGATSYSVNPTNEFNVSLDAFQEANPIGGRTGTGIGTVTLSNNVLKVNATYTGLSAPRNNIHFHAPAVRNPAATAGPAYDIGSITTGTTSGTILGDVPLVAGAYGGKSVAAQIQDLRNGLWYINIHSTAFPGGEIRGQVEIGPRFYRLISP
jgi:hypothetical protein